MTKGEVLNDLYEKFKAPFPKEAYSVDSSRGFDLTSVKAQYIIERLNDVLGFPNWRLEGEFKDNDDGSVTYFGKLILFLGDFTKAEDGSGLFHYIPTVGFSEKKRLKGDSYKAARTDALSKAASYIGVANEVFKGNVNPKSVKAGTTDSSETNKSTKTKVTKPATFQGKTAVAVKDF